MLLYFISELPFTLCHPDVGLRIMCAPERPRWMQRLLSVLQPILRFQKKIDHSQGQAAISELQPTVVWLNLDELRGVPVAEPRP